ncbi:MAG: hypothetical protein A2V67_19420 [Deltaproteobacteria bacterium RBG_13_61_14]|nr:MAG: hypothetical protein A2V67_19420 [Deltaproteobacteria bacterium RBG_13_61_14]
MAQLGYKIKYNFDYLYAREMVLLDGPVQLTTSWQTAWTTLVATRNGSDNARIALVELRVQMSQTAAGVTGTRYSMLEARGYNETGWTYFPSARCMAYFTTPTPAYAAGRNMIMVPLNASRQFQYRCSTDAAGTQTMEIVQLGYLKDE